MLFHRSLTGGKIPVDGVTTDVKQPAENIYLTITFFVLASLGLLVSLCCLFLNSIYRKQE